MPALESIDEKSNERQEEIPYLPENVETVESAEELQQKVNEEILTQHKLLIQEDQKFVMANEHLGLSEEDIDEEKNALNLDAELGAINMKADNLIADTKKELDETSGGIIQEKSQEGGSIDLTDAYDKNPIFSQIGTKDEYRKYIETVFPRNHTATLDDTFLQHGLNDLIDKPDAAPDEKAEKDFLKNYITMMTNEDFKNLNPYKLSHHNVINGLLRNGEDITVENILKYKNMEDNAVTRDFQTDVVESYITIKESIEKSYVAVSEKAGNNEVYRVIQGDELFKDKEIGAIVTDKSFLSTSINKEYTDFYRNDDQEETILTMHFPENSIVNGVYAAGYEKELILPAGMSYEIKNKEVIEVNGKKKILIDVDFLPNEHIRVLGDQKDSENFKAFVAKI